MSAMMLLTSSPLTTFADETLASASSDVQTEAVNEVGSTEQSRTDTTAADTTAADTTATVAATDTAAAADTAADTTGVVAASSENAAADTTAEAAAPVPSVTDATAGQTTTAEAAAAAATNKWTATAADGAVITAEAAENVLSGNLVMEATPEKVTGDVLDNVTQKAVDKQISIEKMAAYDICFKDASGNKVEPNTTNGMVSVHILNPDIQAESADVYHVDEQSGGLADVKSSADNDALAFEAKSFSTYVIIQSGNNPVTVKIQHYKYNSSDINNSTVLYSEDTRTLPFAGSIKDFTKATGWNVSAVYRVNTDGSLGDRIDPTSAGDYSISVASDTTIRVFYSPKSVEYSGGATFFDYYVRDNGSTSINYNGNYAAGSEDTDRIAVGNNKAYQGTTVNGKTINIWCGNGTSKQAYFGIVTGLDENNNVKFSVKDPGLFSSDTKAGKTIYNDYTLNFSKSGDTYALTSVKNGSNMVVASNLNNFFPLNGVGSADPQNDSNNNDYFGMRYDITFTLNDYVGDLNYSFTGDDDLWVILDGKSVVIDLGGIHGALGGTVDLWKVLTAAYSGGTYAPQKVTYTRTPVKDSNNIITSYVNNVNGVTDAEVAAFKNSLTADQKGLQHRLTVLYMERGGFASNCEMSFTLPSASLINTTNSAVASLNINKVNSNNQGLSGANFRLVNDSDSNEVHNVSSDSNGLVAFDQLRPGANYTLTETAAPNGYIATTTTWKVRVSNDSENPVAKLYDESGATEETALQHTDGHYYIVNKTAEEILKSALNYNKTVSVDSWENRTYDINITASSKTTSTYTETTGGVANVMLVLDRSGSMAYGSDSTSTTNASYYEVGSFSSVKDSLVTTNIYYYANNHYVMAYIEDSWQYFDGYQWQTVQNTSSRKVYTCDSRITALKEAVNNFIKSVAEKSPASKIGITSFASTNHGGSSTNASLQAATNTTALMKAADAMSAYGGTEPALGLTLAANEFSSSDSTPKYVIVFTDGEPTGDGDTWSDTAATAASTAASTLKSSNVTVFTVGFALNDNTSSWLSTGIASSSSCAFTANNTSSLLDIFTTISNTITKNTAISGAEIKDVIDDRFDLLNGTAVITKDSVGDDNTTTLADGGSITLNNGGVVKYDSEKKHLYVIWTDQTIPNESSEESNQWSKVLKVKAKDSYIGGNNITTNVSPDSYISTSFGKGVLPQPAVNVKINFSVKDGEKTIFWGDSTAITDDIKTNLLDLGKNTVGSDGTTALTANDFVFTWYTDESCTTAAGNLSELTPDSDTTYYLKVTYKNVGTTTTDSKTNTNGNVASADASKVGKYTIHVVKGQLVITKNIDSQYTDISAKNAEQTFVYKIVRYAVTKDASGNETQDIQPAETFYVTLAFDANGKSTTASSVLSGLKKGYYSVTEETDWSKKYDLTNTADNYSGNSNEGQLIYIGQNKGMVTEETNKGKVIFTGLEPKDSYMKYAVSYTNGAIASDLKTYPAEVTFKNNIKANWYWLSDVAAAVNKFVKQATT